MGSRGPLHLRKTTNEVLDALVQAVERATGGGQPLSRPLLETIVAGLKVSPEFDGFYRRSFDEIMQIVDTETREQRRTNAFGRLMLHPLGPLFLDGSFDRALVPNIFSFLHMVLGDEVDDFSRRCKDVVLAMRQDMGDYFTWDAFYDDPEAKLIYWRVLVRVAASFKRYDARKDWFLKLMQYRPTSVSVASNAFVTREPGPATDDPIIFGEEEFCRFFHALFDPLIDLPPKDDAAFRTEFGADPHHLIGAFLVNLSQCGI